MKFISDETIAEIHNSTGDCRAEWAASLGLADDPATKTLHVHVLRQITQERFEAACRIKRAARSAEFGFPSPMEIEHRVYTFGKQPERFTPRHSIQELAAIARRRASPDFTVKQQFFAEFANDIALHTDIFPPARTQWLVHGLSAIITGCADSLPPEPQARQAATPEEVLTVSPKRQQEQIAAGRASAIARGVPASLFDLVAGRIG